MKKIFAILVIVFALTTVMAAATVITYTDQASARLLPVHRMRSAETIDGRLQCKDCSPRWASALHFSAAINHQPPVSNDRRALADRIQCGTNFSSDALFSG